MPDKPVLSIIEVRVCDAIARGARLPFQIAHEVNGHPPSTEEIEEAVRATSALIGLGLVAINDDFEAEYVGKR